MFLNIISTLISLFIYNFLSKFIKIIFVKKQKNNLKKIINSSMKSFPFSSYKDYWENDLKESDFEK